MLLYCIINSVVDKLDEKFHFGVIASLPCFSSYIVFAYYLTNLFYPFLTIFYNNFAPYPTFIYNTVC